MSPDGAQWVLPLAAGAVIAFTGGRLVKPAVALCGAGSIGSLAAVGASLFELTGQHFWIATGVGALVGMIIALTIFKLGLFLLGAAFGMSLLTMVCEALGVTLVGWWLAPAAVLGGVIVLLKQRSLLGVLTAITGGTIMAVAGTRMLGLTDPPWALPLAAVVLSGLGLVAQSKNPKPKD